jgi:hypothetical protein
MQFACDYAEFMVAVSNHCSCLSIEAIAVEGRPLVPDVTVSTLSIN